MSELERLRKVLEVRNAQLAVAKSALRRLWNYNDEVAVPGGRVDRLAQKALDDIADLEKKTPA